MNGLCIHAGAEKVERGQLALVFTPQRTDTWVPIAHDRFLGGVIEHLQVSGLSIVNEAHALTKDGNRYFGLLQVANGHNPGDYGIVVGVRNSHDKTFPAGLVVGAAVFVCDNLSFSGEIKLARKHAVFVERDLPQLIARAVGQLTDQRRKQDLRFDAYKHTEFTDAEAHDLLIRAIDARVLPVTKLPEVLTEWRTPRHPEFAKDGKTGWRMFNAVTEIIKGNLDFLPRRTQAMHGLLDIACKIDGKMVVGTVETANAA